MISFNYSVIQIILALAKSSSSVEDHFFRDRIDKKVFQFAEAHFPLAAPATHVAQSIHQRLLVINSLAELIEELLYLNIGDKASLSRAQSHLLQYKLDLLKSHNQKHAQTSN